MHTMKTPNAVWVFNSDCSGDIEIHQMTNGTRVSNHIVVEFKDLVRFVGEQLRLKHVRETEQIPTNVDGAQECMNAAMRYYTTMPAHELLGFDDEEGSH